MRLRPPSLGFLYLVGVVVCFVGFFAYIMRPMWWDLRSERQRNHAEAAYLERIVADGPVGKRRAWLSDALRLYVTVGDLDGAERILATAKRFDVSIRGDVLVEVHPKLCWIVGAEPTHWVQAKKSVCIYLHNDSAQQQVVRMHWTAMRNGEGSLRASGEDWNHFKLKKGLEAVVERALPAGGVELIEARVSSPSSNDHDGEIGLRLVRVEIVP